MENKQDQTSYRCDNIYLTTVTDGTIGLGKPSKKSMEFSILSKTHPPHLPSMEKNKNNMV